MTRVCYLLLFAVLAYLATGVAQVRPEERAVVRRFGQVVARPGPGLWVGLPWGIDRLDRVPVRTAQQLVVGYDQAAWSDAPGTPPGQFLTGDQNLVNVQLVLDYAIGETDADLDDYVMHKDAAEAVLAREAEAAAAEWVGGRPVDEVLLTGNAALPAWLMDRLPARVAAAPLRVRELRKTVSREDALAFVWWREVGKVRDLMRARGSRVEPLDAYLGPNGLDLTQLVTPRRR